MELTGQQFPMTWGCTDEIGLANCAKFIFAGDNSTDICRWPTAELCLFSCGQCDRVAAARSCQSLADECRGEFCNGNENIDWGSYMKNLTTRTEYNVEGDNYLRGASILSEDPWVAEFPFFLTEDEADEIIRISEKQGFRDEDELPKHVRDVRVTNCDALKCMLEPFINELSGRASKLLGFPSNNFESIEFIRYERGQHYAWHADEYSWKDEKIDPVAVLSGPRVLTMFFYLSNVDEGGGTAFAGPDMSGGTQRLIVTPRKGKAIVWANLKNDWRQLNPSSIHSAMPVLRGTKLAATLWVHNFGFRIPELYAGKDCRARFF